MVKKTKTKSEKKKKKIIQKIIKQANVYILAGFNNTMLTLTDSSGNVLAWSSTGSVGFKGTKKSTPYAAASATSNLIEKAKAIGVSEVNLLVKGVGPGRDSALRSFANSGLIINSIKDITPVPHGGPRPKKPRRV